MGTVLGECARKTRFTVFATEDQPPRRWKRLIGEPQMRWRSAAWTILLGLIAQAIWLVEFVLPALLGD